MNIAAKISPVKTIYVATDSERVLKQVESAPKDYKVDVLFRYSTYSAMHVLVI